MSEASRGRIPLDVLGRGGFVYTLGNNRVDPKVKSVSENLPCFIIFPSLSQKA